MLLRKLGISSRLAVRKSILCERDAARARAPARARVVLTPLSPRCAPRARPLLASSLARCDSYVNPLTRGFEFCAGVCVWLTRSFGVAWLSSSSSSVVAGALG